MHDGSDYGGQGEPDPCQEQQDAPPAPRAQRGDGRDGAAVSPRLDKGTYLDKEQGDGASRYGTTAAACVKSAGRSLGRSWSGSRVEEKQKTGTPTKFGQYAAHAPSFAASCSRLMPIIS